MSINLNTRSFDIFVKVLDKFYPNWFNREDDYYITELAFIILKVFNAPYTDETIVNNLRCSKVEKYQNELNKIYNMPVEAYKWICNNRMSSDRLKATRARYLGLKTPKSNRTKRNQM